MWLINTTTLALEHHEDTSKIREYAVLSHLWRQKGDRTQEKEISFAQQHYEKKMNTKIKRFCAQAKRDGLQYGWVDTCCIPEPDDFNRPHEPPDDARKSLIDGYRKQKHEAIKSMYEWFQRAKVCYAYLQDVTFDPKANSGFQRQQQLRNSHWFTSGWTLIELIAPQNVRFFQKDWKEFGTKQSMHGIIASITGIPAELLTGAKELDDYTVFERMAWARHRMISSLEDQAYALMGLFGVKMDPEYAEGEQGLLRLREEIQKVHGSSSLDQPAAPLKLLNVFSETLEVEDHPRPCGRVPDYAILSHTWAEGELTYQMVKSGENLEHMASYKKVKGCCELAKKHDFRYLWVDTCCIDRTSSAELQEAICSMYRWYKNAKTSAASITYSVEVEH